MDTQKPIVYDLYKMTRGEKVKYLLIAGGFLFVIGYIFYHSLLISILLAFLAVFYPKMKTSEIVQNRQRKLNSQFKEGLYSLASSLTVGKSIESAFADSLKDLKTLYPDQDTFIVQEFEYIVRKINMNVTVEEAVMDFADRSKLEDVENFADVFITCKRTGGNLIEVIRNTSEIIGDKIQIKEEIAVLLAGKKFEQKILSVAPILLVLFMTWGAGDFMEPVYTTFAGRIVMTVALVLFGISFKISDKIMRIEV